MTKSATFDLAMAQIFRSRQIIARTSKAVAKHGRLMQARYIFEEAVISYDDAEMNRTLRSLEHQITAEYEAAIRHANPYGPIEV